MGSNAIAITALHLPGARRAAQGGLLLLVCACGATEANTGVPANTGGAVASSGGTTASGGEGGVAGAPDVTRGGSGGAAVGSGGGAGAVAGGTAAGGTGQGGTGGAVPVGEVGALGESCSPAGALSCAGNYQKLTLVCGASGAWDVNVTCPGTQICDTRPGVTAGSCQEQDPSCLGHDPGYRFCLENSVHECGPDNLDSPVVQECTGLCTDGVCDNTVDACPTVPIAVNCSDTCGGSSENCATAECSDLRARGVQLDAAEFADYAFVLRTASEPGVDACGCGVSGAGLAPEYSMVINVPSESGPRLVAEVSRPWQLRVEFAEGLPPCSPGEGAQCAEFGGGLGRFFLEVFTYEPNAPTRNVSIRYATIGEEVCAEVP